MKMVTLDEVSESIVDGPFGSNLKTSDYVETSVPVLQGKNITGNIFSWKEIRYISPLKAQELRRSSVVIGDHLLVKIGSIGYPPSPLILFDVEAGPQRLESRIGGIEPLGNGKGVGSPVMQIQLDQGFG